MDRLNFIVIMANTDNRPQQTAIRFLFSIPTIQHPERCMLTILRINYIIGDRAAPLSNSDYTVVDQSLSLLAVDLVLCSARQSDIGLLVPGRSPA